VTVSAGAGDDAVAAIGGAVDVQGGGGNDRIRTGDFADRVAGGAGRDSIAAAGGDDVVRAWDGQRDRVDCGAGAGDAVDADRLDTLVGCESVDAPTGRRASLAPATPIR
jgi:Ca2+-binding RTX toxin-like protein